MIGLAWLTHSSFQLERFVCWGGDRKSLFRKIEWRATFAPLDRRTIYTRKLRGAAMMLDAAQDNANNLRRIKRMQRDRREYP